MKSIEVLVNEIGNVIQSTDPVFLESFISHESAELKRYLALNEYINDKTLLSLLKSSTPLVITAALSHHKAPDYLDEIIRFHQDKPYYIHLISYIFNQGIFNKKQEMTMISILKEKECNISFHDYSQLLKIINFFLAQKDLEIALYNDLSSIVLNISKTKFDRYVHDMVAAIIRSPLVFSQQIDDFYNAYTKRFAGRSIEVEFAINPQTSPKTLLDLAKNKEIHPELIKNPNTPIDALWIIEKESKMDIKNHPGYIGIASNILNKIMDN